MCKRAFGGAVAVLHNILLDQCAWICFGQDLMKIDNKGNFIAHRTALPAAVLMIDEQRA